ncbi:hypothetical protein M0805_002702 [Coniferiporia weirii]|nr:hypothetical protein M0805_002702 [Coniferiporia weirii]
MAAPAPYWKKKTRPCPFYSQGRCLFSDACNFVHSVKVNPDLPAVRTDVALDDGTVGPRGGGPQERSVDDTTRGGYGDGDRNGNGSGDGEATGALRRRSSEGRRRSVMSPPRSPRLSGLLSVLEPLIGPDVEEFEDSDEEGGIEDASNVQEAGTNANALELSPSLYPDDPGEPPSHDFYNGSFDTDKSETTPAADTPDAYRVSSSFETGSPFDPFPETINTISLNDSPSPPPFSPPNGSDGPTISTPKRPPTLRAHIPSPIITQHPEDHTTENSVPDNNTLELRPDRPLSTFDLLSSPFLSPALRIRSPQLFPTREPNSPIFGSLPGTSSPRTKPYSDDDLESLETLDSSAEESGERSSSSLSSLENESYSKTSSDDSQDSIEVPDSPMESLESSGSDLGSPHETERPASDYFRTPRNVPRRDDIPTSELDDLPPLPPSLTRNVDGTNRTLSQITFSTEQRDLLHRPLPMEDSPDSTDDSRLRYTPPSPYSGVSVTSDLKELSEDVVYPLIQDNMSSPHSQDEAMVMSSSHGVDDVSSRDSPAFLHGDIPDKVANEDRLSSFPSSALASTISYLTPISIDSDRNISLDSPTNGSLGPSPVSTDLHSSYTSDTLVEPDDDLQIHGSPFKPQAKIIRDKSNPKRLTVTSPTKLLREAYSPASLEKTIRAAPSPLHEEAPRPGSSMSSVSSSSRLSWMDVSKKVGAAQKVPFGFRQSLHLGQAQSSPPLRGSPSYFTRDSIVSQISSTSSLSLIYASQPRSASRVELLSGRARSVSPASPAPFASSRNSAVFRTNSAPSRESIAFAHTPRSASQLDFASNRARSESPVPLGGSEPSSSRPPTWMRPFRLSQIAYTSPVPSDQQSPNSVSSHKRFSIASIPSFASHVRKVSQGSSVKHSLPSSARSSLISAYLNDSDIPSHDIHPPHADGSPQMSPLNPESSSSRPNNSSQYEAVAARRHSRSTDTSSAGNIHGLDLLSPLSGSMRGLDFDDLPQWQWSDIDNEITLREPSVHNYATPAATVEYSESAPLVSPPAANYTPAPAYIPTPSHAIATPRPTLIFAIASDDPAEVERVLASGEARPNDDVGPQSALEFALTNDALVHKTEIVKLLLAYGANPSTLPADLRTVHAEHTRDEKGGASGEGNEDDESSDVLADLPSDGSPAKAAVDKTQSKKRESALNPAMKYYLNRASASQSSAALRRSDFRSLARMRFDFVGQDRALEHLYWVLGMHSQQPIGTPLVVLCCGPSGHGKSLLARKFGSLLDVPTHTVNMTILKTSHDLWQCPSMSPYDQPSDRTLAEFLTDNEGKRCVVVLDEIDKNEDDRTLWSLLAPWELGRCSIDAGRRHIDVRNVIWLGTSNIGQDLVFEHYDSRKDSNTMISKAEYRELMNLLRPRVTERLGTSLMSRVTAVLPFVPFTDEEKLAIASEAVLALGGEMASELSPTEFENLAAQCVAEYVSTDGARSLYRSVSTHLMEAF